MHQEKEERDHNSEFTQMHMSIYLETEGTKIHWNQLRNEEAQVVAGESVDKKFRASSGVKG